jgi:hypothetical protein
VRAEEGCISVRTYFTYTNNLKISLLQKLRTVKYVLTRSSEFQENRRKFRRKEIPRQKQESTPWKIPLNKLAHKNNSNKQNCQIILTKSDSVKIEIQETDLRKKHWIKKLEKNLKTLTELERVAAAILLRVEEKPDASTAAATSSSGMEAASAGEPLLAAMACLTCSKNWEVLSSRTMASQLTMSFHFFLNWLKSPSELTEIGVKKSMKNQNIKKNPKNQKNKDKSSNGTKRTNQKGVKLKIKIAKLKTNRQCEKYFKTSGSNESTT